MRFRFRRIDKTLTPPPATSPSNAEASQEHQQAPVPPLGGSTSNRKQNRQAIIGLALSLLAVVPPAWLAYEFAVNPEEWLEEGSGLYGDTSVFTAFFVTLVVIPFELALLTPAYILSSKSSRWARRESQSKGAVGTTGLIVSVAATALLTVVVIVAYANA